MKKLHPVSLSRLSILEIGQHIKSVVSGIKALDNSTTTIADPILQNYLNQSGVDLDNYDKALLQITKSDETAKIVVADGIRDVAVSALFRYLTVFELSEVAAEVDAFASLNTLAKKYRGLQRWNFEEESNGIDQLVADLNNEKYTPMVNLLNMTNYVTRVATRNNEFKTLFAGRTQEVAFKEVYDVKQLRTNLKNNYNDLVTYVLSMAKAKELPQYDQSLNIINTVRNYYFDLLAKRKGTTASILNNPIPPMP
jgi:hypothetical protein